MFGGLISLGLYWLVLLALGLWILLRTWRSSPLLAIISFFFFPATLVALLRQWNDPETDIKIPFFLSLVTIGAMVWAAGRTVDQAIDASALYYSEEDIALIREENPEFAAQIEAAQQEQLAQLQAEADAEVVYEDGDADTASEGDASTPGDDTVAAAPVAVDPEVERQATLRRLAADLGWQRGSVRLDAAHATLVLPKHFRFVGAGTLYAISQAHQRPIDRFTLGWVVHEREDISAPGAWFVEVRHEPTGYLSPGGAKPEDLANEVSGAMVSGLRGPPFGTGYYAPLWQPRETLITYGRELPQEGVAGATGYDLVAARPLRGGILVFRVRGLDAGTRELGLRATRLLARALSIDAGHRYGDYQARRDGAAVATLGHWVASR
jgi:hypothetical protein